MPGVIWYARKTRAQEVGAKQSKDDHRSARDRLPALLAAPSAIGSERLRSSLVSRSDRPSTLQGARTGCACACAASEDLRGARQPGGKGIRPGGAGEDQAILRG